MKIVYLLVKSSDGTTTYWNRAGVAFPNRDGSINVKLDFFPDLTFQVREQDKKKDG